MPKKEPIWVNHKVVYLIHQSQIKEHGGMPGVRDQGLLESALMRAMNMYDYTNPKPTIPQLAASYAFGIAKNHPFFDGNKRTSLIVCELFLRLNGYSIKAKKEDKYITFLSLAEGSISEDELASWISEYAIKQ